MQDTGVTSAAVPVKKHPTKFFNSFGYEKGNDFPNIEEKA